MSSAVGQGLKSRFGEYHGKKAFDGCRRTSDYLALADGTRLAYDLILPTNHGVPEDRPLPVLFKYTPYGRAWTVFDKKGKSNLASLEALPWYAQGFLRLRSWLSAEGDILGPLWRTKWLGSLVQSGYAVVVVERPGTGASFGTYSPTDAAMATEADQILNWISSQRWSNGNIGMYGDSVQAQVQLAAASTCNPHLKALFAESTWLDIYQSFMYPGGIFCKSFGEFYAWSQRLLDSSLVTPVDRDADGSLLARARAERRGGPVGKAALGAMSQFHFRDSLMPDGRKFWELISAYPMLDQINRSRIPVYLINGWFDPLARENFFLYSNLRVPKRMIVRPTDHGQEDETGHDVDYAAEAHRWFDHWLKGIDNGIMEEPPIHYYLMGADKPRAWQTSTVWPPSDSPTTRYYLGAGRPGSTESVNNGTLALVASSDSEAADAYRVDYTTTTGKKARWTAVNWAHHYPNMRSNDAKALTYTAPPLASATRVVGHPTLHLWATSDAPDFDVFAYLEEVDSHGNSVYITEGCLRASHRTLTDAPYDTFGLPYHGHRQTEVKPVPAGEPVQLDFDLLPTAYQFSPGKRIRIVLAGADADNFDTPIQSKPPNLLLLRSATHPSWVDLPASLSG